MMEGRARQLVTVSNPRKSLELQDFYLVWLDETINVVKNDYRNSITKLQQLVNSVSTFTQVGECIDHITGSRETVFMIVSGKFSEVVLPIVASIPHVSRVYIFCQNYSKYEKQAKNWSKVEGVYTNITPICESLKQVIKEHQSSITPISVTNYVEAVPYRDIDRLDCSFMYTQILKEILLTMSFDETNFKEFIVYCRQQFVGNDKQMRNVDKFEREYDGHRAIWWFTHDFFLNSMVGRALRTMEMDLIVMMGFFIRDLHNQIASLHAQQYGERSYAQPFIVYRGQSLSQTDFEQLKIRQGGLLAYNQFLSTSLDRQIAFRFARYAAVRLNLVGIVFVMTIDPTISTTPFANVKHVGCYPREEEVLFSMHTKFRIKEVKQSQEDDALWEVQLTLTNDNDPQLSVLTNCIRTEIHESTGLFQMGRLMMQTAQFDTAEQIFRIMFCHSNDDIQKGQIYSYVGCIKYEYGEYAAALSFFEEALRIQQKMLPANHPHVAVSYSNMSLVYLKIGEYLKALSFCEKALEIRQKTLPANHPDLATSYNDVATVFSHMGEYSKALSFCEKALEIRQKTLPANHPSLATSYNDFAAVFSHMGEYSKALSFYERALEIRQKALPANHPNLATSYNDFATVYSHMEEYPKALSFCEKALEIRQKTLPANHPDFAVSYNNIGLVYLKIGEYSKALCLYEKAFEIRQKTLPANHPDLATSYNDFAPVYSHMGEYSKALSFCEKALEIREKTLPVNHPDLASSYNIIGQTYYLMNEFPRALSYFERALDILQRSMPSNHPHITNMKTSIENTKQRL